MGLTPEQYMTLRKPLNTTRVAKRSQGAAAMLRPVAVTTDSIRTC